MWMSVPQWAFSSTFFVGFVLHSNLRRPQPDYAIRPGSQNIAAVGRKDDILDLLCLPRKTSHLLTSFGIPQPCSPIITARQDETSIPRHGNPHGLVMSDKLPNSFTAGNIP